MPGVKKVNIVGEQPERIYVEFSHERLATLGLGGNIGDPAASMARALVLLNGDWVSTLRKHGLLTRDARIKERKKYGQKGARKRFQFSKR